MKLRTLVTTAVTVFLGACPIGAQNPPDPETPVRTVLDPGVIPSRQTITPAGLQTVFEDREWGVAFGPSNDAVYALVGAHRASLVYKRTGAPIGSSKKSGSRFLPASRGSHLTPPRESRLFPAWRTPARRCRSRV
jgi:hypothetical protein